MPSRNDSPNRSESFGRLLSGAINSIATYEGKTAPTVEDELGALAIVVGKTIQRYKAGHLPPEARTIEILAQAAVRRGYLGREWLQRFLYAARYPFADKLLDELCPIGPARPRPPRVYHNLPAPTYSQFVMRKDAFAEVLDGLQQRSAVVLIVGLGGNGKTSLAREVAESCLNGSNAAPQFDAVVWISDKDRPGTTNLSVVLDEIARTLNYPGFTQLEIEEKRREVEQLLKRQRGLVIVDNFETINDGALLAWLLRLPEPSKAIITSREYGREYRRGGWPVELRGMHEAEARYLVVERVRVLKIERLVGDLAQLEPLLIATGGNPKAIEIALGIIKYEHHPLHQIVDNLYVARGELFDDLFTRAWALLDAAAQAVLLSMPLFLDSASGAAIAATADVHGFGFDRALERLTDLALLDVQQANVLHAPRYTVHPLTRFFTQARLRELPEFERQARLRWAKYFLDFVTSTVVLKYPQERYWNALGGGGLTPIDPEWFNLLSVLEWADQAEKNQTLIDLIMLLVHYMDRRALYAKRIQYAEKAAEAAQKVGQKRDQALLRIDALGWTLIEESRLEEAEHQIIKGLHIAESLIVDSTDAQDLIALATVFLARIYIFRGDIPKASILIEQAMAIECQTVIRYRVLMIAGDLAYRNRSYQETSMKAVMFFKDAMQYQGDKEYIISDIYRRLGFIHLSNRDTAQAEAAFREVLNFGDQAGVIEIIHGRYGFACIAHIKGEIEQARRLAEEAIESLSRLHINHRLLKEIKEFLAHLDDHVEHRPAILF